jgi:heme-degrading monooxygenase HmoA
MLNQIRLHDTKVYPSGERVSGHPAYAAYGRISGAPPPGNGGQSHITDEEHYMIAVIFESWPKSAKMQTYLDMGAALRSHLETLDGFISIERFQSLSDPDKLVALSFWRDEAAVDAWRNREIHRAIQKGSRRDVFRDYRLRVASVIRDYTMSDRNQAPADSQYT